MLDLSIIIINYNTKIMTKNLIKSINEKCQNITYEIIIVDNSNLDNQRLIDNEDLEDINIIYMDNKGFGSACNQGARVANGKYLLFINSDILIGNDVMKLCVEYMTDHINIGVLGCKLILQDGKIDHGCKRGFPTPQASLYYYLKLDKLCPQSKKYGAYRLSYLNDNEINEVDAVSGAFLMIRKTVFDDIGGFDETFFMYGEDLDLCLRVKEAGYKIIYFPKAVVTHLKGQSGLNIKNKTVLYHFYNAMIIFYDKHYKKKYSVFVTWLVYIAIRCKYYFNLLKLKVRND